MLKRLLTPTKPVDVCTLQRLEEHPCCAALHEQWRALREQQRTWESARQRATSELSEMNAAGETRPSVLRAARKKLEELEEEGERLQATLLDLAPEMEAAKTAAKLDIRQGLQGDAAAVLQGLLAALEHVAEATGAYQAFCRQSRQLLGGSMLPLGLLDPSLASRIHMTKQTLAKLR